MEGDEREMRANEMGFNLIGGGVVFEVVVFCQSRAWFVHITIVVVDITHHYNIQRLKDGWGLVRVVWMWMWIIIWWGKYSRIRHSVLKHATLPPKLLPSLRLVQAILDLGLKGDRGGWVGGFGVGGGVWSVSHLSSQTHPILLLHGSSLWRYGFTPRLSIHNKHLWWKPLLGEAIIEPIVPLADKMVKDDVPSSIFTIPSPIGPYPHPCARPQLWWIATDQYHLSHEPNYYTYSPPLFISQVEDPILIPIDYVLQVDIYRGMEAMELCQGWGWWLLFLSLEMLLVMVVVLVVV